jgi:hypothetical protein
VNLRQNRTITRDIGYLRDRSVRYDSLQGYQIAKLRR